MNRKTCTLILGITSGIGYALADHLGLMGETVVGTTRGSEEIGGVFASVFHLDMSSLESISSFVEEFSKEFIWERLVFCPAVMDPIGQFRSLDIEKWMRTFNVNFTNQVYLLHKLLPLAGGVIPRVLFFAGGGTNSAPKNYTAYTLSKISLIKLTELLNEEIDEICFSILGPGWVKTKIHAQSLSPGMEQLPSFKETERRLIESDFVPMEEVVRSILWIFSQSKDVVGGRNFSTAHDPFDSSDFAKLLSSDYDALKLRRHGNDLIQQINSD